MCNGQEISVCDVATVGEAVVCACSPHRAEAIAPALRGMAALMPRARSVRLLGSGVLNFAWVACGRLAAYWEPELAPWDSIAGTLLVQEAGGMATDAHDGSLYTLQTRSVLASNGPIHHELLELLRDAKAGRCDDDAESIS